MNFTRLWFVWILGLGLAVAQVPRDVGPVPENVTVEAEAQTSDEAIKQRLQAIFDAIGGEGQIGVTMQSGVVTLTGQVAEAQDAIDAELLTKNTAGVVYVRNRIQRTDELAARLDPAVTLLGVAGVVGIAFGFAFRNIVENYLAGVLLSLRNPFSTGDLILASKPVD